MDSSHQTPTAPSASRLSPIRFTGLKDPFSHCRGKGDSGYSSFSNSSNAPEYLSSAHVHESAGPSEKVFYQGSEALKQPGVKATRIGCDADAMGTEERSVCQSMKNYSSVQHDSPYRRSEPPPLPTRRDSFLATRQHECLINCTNIEEQYGPNVVERQPTGTKTFKCDQQPVKKSNRPSERWQSYWQPLWMRASRRHNLTESTEAYTSARSDKALQNDSAKPYTSFHPRGSNVPANCSESQKQAYIASQAHGNKLLQKPSPQDFELPPIRTLDSVNDGVQKAVPYFCVTSTDVQTSGGEYRPKEPTFTRAKSSENVTEKMSHQHKTDYKPQLDRNCNDRLGSLGTKGAARLSSVHLPSVDSPPLIIETQTREPGFNSRGCTGSHVFYSGPDENVHTPRPASSVLDAAQATKRNKYLNERRASNSTSGYNTESRASQSNPYASAKSSYIVPEDPSPRPGWQDIAKEYAISAENTPLLHCLTSESKQMAKNIAVNSKNKWQASDPAKGPPKEVERNYILAANLHSGIEQDMSQLRRARSSTQLFDEDHVFAPNEESPDPVGSLINCSKKDYRNKIKDAQTKVLLQTSFKRKDLQFSWPNRMKQKSVERPTIAHLRTYSLSSSNQGLGDPTVMSPQALYELQDARSLLSQHQIARIGGRKRLTAMQKKMCYSEPEKINQLGVSNSQRKFSLMWEQGKTINCPDPHRDLSFVGARKHTFESDKASSTLNLSKEGKTQIRQDVLAEYMERKKGQKPAGRDLVFPEKQRAKPVPPRNISDWNCNPFPGSDEEPKISRHKSAEILWELRPNYSMNHQGYSNVSAVYSLKQEPVARQLHTQADSRTSSKCASAEDLLDQLAFAQFSDRARSKSSPLLPQNIQRDLLTGPSSQASLSNRTDNWDSVSSRSHIPEINPTPEFVCYPIDYESIHHDRELRKRAYERQRVKSLDELETPVEERPIVFSRSSDQLHRSVKGNRQTNGLASETGVYGFQRRPNREHMKWDSTELQRKNLPRAPARPPSSQLNWNKTKAENINEPGSGLDPVSSAEPGYTVERCYNVSKIHNPYSSPESSPKTPSPLLSMPFPPWRTPSQEDHVFYEDSYTKSETVDINLSPASENASPRSNLTKLHVSRTFDSLPTEIPMENKLKITEKITSGNISPTRNDYNLTCLKDNREEEQTTTETVAKLKCPVTNLEEIALISVEQTRSGESQSVTAVGHQEGETKANSEPHAEGQDEVSLSLRVKTPEDLLIESLMKEVLDQDQSLADVLDPSSTKRTTMDLVEGLFRTDTWVLDACQMRKKMNVERKEMATQENRDKRDTQLSSPTAGTNNQMRKSVEDKMGRPSDIAEKKRELIDAINCKLQKLQERKVALTADIRANDLLGENIEAWVEGTCKPHEVQKYKTFIKDLDKVLNLLLSLSSRLARVENALNKVNEATDSEEKKSLNERHHTLSGQHEDARGLKEHQDHRERMTFNILSNYLTETQLQDSQQFIQTTKILLIEQRDLDEHLKLTEDQLECLQNSLES
eukprot:gi/632948656/ref/XP_007889714.1/ PREDICTED: protein Shroom1 [Callorhinchus milii]